MLARGMNRVAPEAARAPAQSDLRVLKQIVQSWHKHLQKSGRLQAIATQLARAELFANSGHRPREQGPVGRRPIETPAPRARHTPHRFEQQERPNVPAAEPGGRSDQDGADVARRTAHLVALQRSAVVLQEAHQSAGLQVRRIPYGRSVLAGGVGIVVVAALFQLMTKIVTAPEPVATAASPPPTVQTPVPVRTMSVPQTTSNGLVYTVAAATRANVIAVPAERAPEAGQQPAVDRREMVRRVQAALLAAGLDPGPLDGLDGSRTRAAVLAFQAAHRMNPTGIIDAELVAVLLPGG